MKKNYLKWSILGLSMVLILNSCVQEETTPVAVEEKAVVESINELVAGSENFRKAPNGVVYQEKFSNSIDIIPAEGFTPEIPFPAFYPGTGVGNATYLGKSYSFINQYAYIDLDLGFPVTIGASINHFPFIVEQMKELGVMDVPNEVHSLTTDGKGNTIYFKNNLNITTPVSDTRINFVAKVDIIGGTGIFENASGKGEVIGYFNPEDKKGETTLRASINF